MAPSLKSLTVDHRAPPPARRLTNLVQTLLRGGRSAALQAIRNGSVRVNGRPNTNPDAILAAGDLVEATVASGPDAASPADRLTREPVKIIFQDESLAVVSKPPALLTVPTRHREPRTVISELNGLLRRANASAEAFCVHRLDRGVSGLLVFAKSLEMAHAMRQQFAERKPDRNYLAIVAGQLARPSGTLRSHLVTDKNLTRHSSDDEETGELAITHFRTIETWSDATLIEVRLETGRRNQIRVHFAELGHPVLGDSRYNPARSAHRAWPYRRLALHAESLGFTHPITSQRLDFHLPPPSEFDRCQRTLERRR